MINAFFILFLVSVFISSISQILLKKSADKEYENTLKEYLNPRVIAAYSIFLISTVLTTIAYRGVPLSIGPVLESTGYVYIAVLSVFVLKEKMSKKKILGNVLIIAGILVCALL
jgi:multidrug transporter EmrE-like cation transporter